MRNAPARRPMMPMPFRTATLMIATTAPTSVAVVTEPRWTAGTMTSSVTRPSTTASATVMAA